MLILIATFPGAFVGAFFGGSLLIETIFSLDGLGLLGFTSVVSRDYPVVFATLYMFSLLGLVIGADLGPHLYLGRSAPRFRKPRAMNLAAGHSVAAQPAVSPIAKRRLQLFRRQPPRLLVAVAVPRPVRRVAGVRIHRLGPADPCLLQGRMAVALRRRLSREQVRRLPRHDQLSRPGQPRRDRGQWLDAVAADPLFLRHGRQQSAGARPCPADLDDERGGALRRLSAGRRRPRLHRRQHALARHRRPGPRRGGAAALRLSHLGAVRARPHHHLVGDRRRRWARCRAISAAGPTF